MVRPARRPFVKATPERIERLPKWAREHIEALRASDGDSDVTASIDAERIERLPDWAREHIRDLARPRSANDAPKTPTTQRLKRRPRTAPGASSDD